MAFIDKNSPEFRHAMMETATKLDELLLNFDLDAVSSLSASGREKLKRLAEVAETVDSQKS